MSFQFTDQHHKDYYEKGFTIFRSIVPTSLLTDLRRETDKGRLIARKRSGESAQRLQPIVNYPEIDFKPFVDFHHLPALVDALNTLFEAGFGKKVDVDATREVCGVLYEPATRPWCTNWHRDWRDNARGLRLAEWDKRLLDIRMFNQVNCALYDDSCTWVVPGSHLRRDTTAEIRRFPDRPIQQPDFGGLNIEDAEAAVRDYTLSMPGAYQAHLFAGDYMLYRNSLWHLGSYLPYRKRATIHDSLFSDDFREWFKNPPFHPAKADGTRDWENPNINTLTYQQCKAEQTRNN
ncbi:MAG: hypothetical protein IT444_05575 [Phycisphaeraceae bacterium]|nr:hypothetical protein [Phycisphaeraceae bacterium]